VIQGTRYILRVVRPEKMFGLRKVWRRETAIPMSDPSRTIADILNEPQLGGGIRHVAEVIREYFSSEHRNDSLLTDYVSRMGNRTIAKRLGYLVEGYGIEAPAVIGFCRKNKSAGYSKLDPGVIAKGCLTRDWNLRINVRIPFRGEGT
jgi:predicted transcriptional regulator of viral defense system